MLNKKNILAAMVLAGLGSMLVCGSGYAMDTENVDPFSIDFSDGLSEDKANKLLLASQTHIMKMKDEDDIRCKEVVEYILFGSDEYIEQSKRIKDLLLDIEKLKKSGSLSDKKVSYFKDEIDKMGQELEKIDSISKNGTVPERLEDLIKKYGFRGNAINLLATQVKLLRQYNDSSKIDLLKSCKKAFSRVKENYK